MSKITNLKNSKFAKLDAVSISAVKLKDSLLQEFIEIK